MPKKITKTTKSGSQTLKSSDKNSESVLFEKKNAKNKDTSKKVVVKRRRTDLKPTRASAVAIAAQANRVKKQALIEKMSKSVNIPFENKEQRSEEKIPTWIWIFFWCSLLLFCISFYQVILRPQMWNENVNIQDIEWVDSDNEIKDGSQSIENDEDENLDYEYKDEDIVEIDDNQKENYWIEIPQTASDVINEYFSRLSGRDFDWAFDLMIPALRGYPDIRNHFTAFRMDPFLDWVEWWRLSPKNIQYIKSPSYWKDLYKFDLSYTLKSNQEVYEETWEFGINTSSWEPKISSIRCISSKCSYHPIFWPENFGLMR